MQRIPFSPACESNDAGLRRMICRWNIHPLKLAGADNAKTT